MCNIIFGKQANKGQQNWTDHNYFFLENIPVIKADLVVKTLQNMAKHKKFEVLGKQSKIKIRCENKYG